MPKYFRSMHERGQWSIAVGNQLDELRVWIIQHDMKVLDSVDALQALPVLEPDDVLARDFAAEGPFNKVFDALSGLRRQVICAGNLLERELGPYDKMNDFLVNAIRPVVVEDLDVVWEPVGQR
jgi:hypothetical protein